jgi:ATP-dependent Clp protease ATP-binding subunit ClpA
LRRAIERYVENPLSTKLLRGDYKAGDAIEVDVADEELAFKVKTPMKVA